MTEEDKILSELTEIERKVLPVLKDGDTVTQLVKKTGLKDVEVLRGFQWLSNKGLVELTRKEEELIFLDKNGEIYQKKGLPEKTFLKELQNGEKSMKAMLRVLSKEEINVCIGLLKKQLAINIEKTDEGLIFFITKYGEEMLKKANLEELFLEIQFPVKEESLEPQEKKAFIDLMKRKKIIKKDKKVEYSAKLTKLGEKLSKKKITDNYSEKITVKMLKDKSWKNTKFRAFDVESKVPLEFRGKKHFVNEAVEYIRSIWLEMGFEEMSGTQSQSAFWDLDTLFVPQDHPAREMQDTFYLEEKSDLPKELLKKVKKVHETGGNTGSKGWRTTFSSETAKRSLLRTHTTVISAQTIFKLKKEDLPKKFFTVGKVFRNESLDWKHLFEFQQVEGIVVDPDANMTKLKSYIKEFFFKMGYTDVRIRPAHFPYTEPSAEVEAYNPHKKQWVEMGGSGIFRPEVTKTLLGFECPVLAWGLGMERIIATYFNIQDIRDLYKNDLDQLKKMKSFMK